MFSNLEDSQVSRNREAAFSTLLNLGRREGGSRGYKGERVRKGGGVGATRGKGLERGGSRGYKREGIRKGGGIRGFKREGVRKGRGSRGYKREWVRK